MKNFEYALREIALAKVASDGAKGLNYYRKWEKINIRNSRRSGYSCKQKHLLNAINALRRTPNKGVYYYVSAEPDQNGYPSVLVYFEIEKGAIGNDRELQISFHTPMNRAGGIFQFINSGRYTEWNGGGNGYSVMEAITEYLAA